MEDRKLSVAEVARRLGVSKYTVDRLRRQGLIAYHKPGRRVTLNESDVDAYDRSVRIEAKKEKR